ncbi:hypothetical protein GSB9_03164 [Flavobacteriaceae bacterium GSB9]|jgi:hypothetical protein|nr:hypothetical protein GSB9_03164 [Flavobacteriaceae bacterium GSB9]
MKKIKSISLLFFLLFSLAIFSQEKTIESLKTEINSQEKLLSEKQSDYEFLSKFIQELEKSDGDNSELIKTKKTELKTKEIEILKIKATLFDLTSKVSKLDNANNPETIPERIESLKQIEQNVNTKIAEFNLNEKSKLAFKNKTIKYKATIWNTNFSIPIARFNFTKDNDTKFGDIQMFNSIGAGFGKSWGTMTDYRDENGDLENSDFVNSFSIHGGFLFSAGTEDNNVFAPVLTIGVLDFQLGFGVELGTIKEDQERVFLTLGYAIPLYKLTKGKYLFSKKGRILNEIDTDL